MDSILTSIKQLLGISEDDESFDNEIIMHINTALMVLTDIGVGPSEGFNIEDKNAEWTDFVSTMSKMAAVKTYVFASVKLIFDPPSSSAAIDALERTKKEYEWRLNSKSDTGGES